MNTKKLFSLTVIVWFTIAGTVAGSNERGIDLYRAGLYDAAKIFFLQQKNQSVQEQTESYYYLGRSYYALQKTDSASHYYARAIEIDPTYPLGHVGIGELALARGDVKAAEASFKTAVGLVKKDPSVQTAIADIYVDAGMFSQAENALTKAEKIDKKYSGIFMVRGNMALKQEKQGQAYSWFGQVIHFNPNDKEAYLRLARAYENASPPTALSYLNQLLAIDPNYIPAFALIGDINRAMGMYYQALEAYEKFISIPGVPLLQRDRYAQLLYLTNQFESALQEINYVLERDPANTVMHRLRAYTLFKLGNTSLAAQELGAFLRNTPEDQHISLDYITYGQALIKENQSEAAITVLHKALALDPAKAEIYRELASAYEGVRDFPEAIRMYEKYFELADNPNVFDFLMFGLANYYAAAQFIDEDFLATRTTPEQKQEDEAEFRSFVEKGNAAFSEVIERSPESHLGYLWRARLYTFVDLREQEGKGKAMKGYAKPYYEGLLQLIESTNANAESRRNTEVLEAYDYLASYYLLLDDKTNAVEYYRKS